MFVVLSTRKSTFIMSDWTKWISDHGCINRILFSLVTPVLLSDSKTAINTHTGDRTNNIMNSDATLHGQLPNSHKWKKDRRKSLKSLAQSSSTGGPEMFGWYISPAIFSTNLNVFRYTLTWIQHNEAQLTDIVDLGRYLLRYVYKWQWPLFEYLSIECTITRYIYTWHYRTSLI